MNTDRPDWLTLPAPKDLDTIKQMLDAAELHTVCEGADCPNIGECFGSRTCTFMILGDTCTRNCRFCAVTPGIPLPPNPREPQGVALAAQQLGLKHVVITSVTRDDLPDGGSGQFAATILAVRKEVPDASIEVLIPDFRGDKEALVTVLQAQPDILNHNIETVPRLYPEARPQAVYTRSLQLLERAAKSSDAVTKSGMMLGLGEGREEILEVMRDLRAVGCQILTLGQYLSPSPSHLRIREYVTPETFKQYEQIGLEMGFLDVFAGPLVRSSYNAARTFKRVLQKKGGRKNGES